MLEIQTMLPKYIEGVTPAIEPPVAQLPAAQPPAAQPPAAQQQQPVYNQSFTHMLNSW